MNIPEGVERVEFRGVPFLANCWFQHCPIWRWVVHKIYSMHCVSERRSTGRATMCAPMMSVDGAESMLALFMVIEGCDSSKVSWLDITKRIYNQKSDRRNYLQLTVHTTLTGSCLEEWWEWSYCLDHSEPSAVKMRERPWPLIIFLKTHSISNKAHVSLLANRHRWFRNVDFLYIWGSSLEQIATTRNSVAKRWL